MDATSRMHALLKELYGAAKASAARSRLQERIDGFSRARRRNEPAGYFSEKDIALITYADSLQREQESPLVSLHRFAGAYLAGVVSTIHLLPFFPFSSDDGFAVKDYFSVDPRLGRWADVCAIGEDFDLMFDVVVNHFSARSQWLQLYLDGAPGFEDFAIAVDPTADLSGVTRPRSLPLLTEFTRTDGRPVHLWTTFSADQIDFNFKSVDVMLKMVDVMLYYVSRGARILRLDAIAYLWKEIGTRCVHLRQTHAFVKLLRAILDQAAPEVILLTETNVPHEENISYFGRGDDEAQMVYNFSLPPLLLHAFLTGDASMLSSWAEKLTTPSDQTTYFNFTASHDGIGVRPLEGILAADEMTKIIAAVKRSGGRVSFRRNPDGSESPYELNITYLDAVLAGSQACRARKFLASQSIQYCLPGVPGTYVHSLLGSRNWTEGVRRTGRARTVNREKLDLNQVISALNDRDSWRSSIFYPYRRLMRTRAGQPAFHPNAAFKILDLHPSLFAIRRHCDRQTIHALTNVSSKPVVFDPVRAGIPPHSTDLVGNRQWDRTNPVLAPYQYIWLSDCGLTKAVK